MLLYCWRTNRISHVHITSGSRLYYRNDVSSTCKLMVNINMYSDYWHYLNTTVLRQYCSLYDRRPIQILDGSSETTVMCSASPAL